jgi:predicted nucleic acid-binding protein
MILVDTSVVIDWLRGKDAKLQVLIPSLPVAVCGVTLAELLHGSRDLLHRQKLLADVAAFQLLAIPEALWMAVGDHLAAMRRKGITVPFADAVIATVGIENDIEVWARDPHFPTMHTVLPALKLFGEPP